MKEVKLAAKPREGKGSGPAGRLRHKGFFPAVVYGEGKSNRNVQLNEHDFRQTLKGHVSESLILDLDVEGQGMSKVLIKEVQHHPLTGQILHVDFHEISMTKKLRVEIPVALVGDPVGVTQMGGVLEHLLRTVEVECLPSDIIEHVTLDVSALSVGDSLNVGHIQLDPAKYHIVSDKGLAVATVAAPKAEEEVAPTAAEAAAAGPEVITEKKVEGEEGAEEGKDGKKGGQSEAKKPAAGKEEAKDDKKAKEKK